MYIHMYISPVANQSPPPPDTVVSSLPLFIWVGIFIDISIRAYIWVYKYVYICEYLYIYEYT